MHRVTACPLQVTHWHSPRFFAYFPTASSYPAMLADMLCGAIGCIGFSWVSDVAGACPGDTVPVLRGLRRGERVVPCGAGWGQPWRGGRVRSRTQGTSETESFPEKSATTQALLPGPAFSEPLGVGSGLGPGFRSPGLGICVSTKWTRGFQRVCRLGNATAAARVPSTCFLPALLSQERVPIRSPWGSSCTPHPPRAPSAVPAPSTAPGRPASMQSRHGAGPWVRVPVPAARPQGPHHWVCPGTLAPGS